MPQVTSIEPQKSTKGRPAAGGKDPQRFNVFIDGQFAFGIDQYHLVKYKLKVSQKLTDLQIVQLAKALLVTKLQDSIFKYLSIRPRSQKEAQDYLAKKIAKIENLNYQNAKSSPLIAVIITSLKKKKFLDDLEFARWLVSSRIKNKPKGVRFLKMELKQKGIDDQIVETVLTQNLDEFQLAKKAISKKIGKWQKLPEKELRKKVYNFLLSRGFGYEIVSQVFAFFQKKF